ncbi:hypothetical protein [Paenibacillus yonginensis]|uniref:hypothetical protein n=1 Tax=Paenibacillus yonginensis TaxID=1462996 RepID=UPI00083920A6|nr:hypothetical protein [Paenibacillus yonginensis]
MAFFSENTIKICRSLGIDITFTVKRGMNHAGQLNGYRVNAGGADNDPAVLVEYMKEGAPEPKRTQTLNRPYDVLGPDDKLNQMLTKRPKTIVKRTKAAG